MTISSVIGQNCTVIVQPRARFVFFNAETKGQDGSASLWAGYPCIGLEPLEPALQTMVALRPTDSRSPPGGTSQMQDAIPRQKSNIQKGTRSHSADRAVATVKASANFLFVRASTVEQLVPSERQLPALSGKGRPAFDHCELLWPELYAASCKSVLHCSAFY